MLSIETNMDTHVTRLELSDLAIGMRRLFMCASSYALGLLHLWLK